MASDTQNNGEIEMSRTIRRKNTTYSYYWDVGSSWWYRLKPTLEECIQEKAKYHSDSGWGSYNRMAAPHWYRRYLNKREKTKEKLDILKFCRSEEYDVLKPKRVRNASWYW